MKKLFKNTFGFGLVEVLIAAGLAGGLALTIAKLSQNAGRVTKTAETNNEINMFMTDAAFILSDKNNCKESLIPYPAVSIPANGTLVNSIVKKPDAAPAVPVYTTGLRYGNELFTITKMETEYIAPNASLRITFTRNNAITNGAKTIVKKIPLKAVITGTNMTGCFSDTENMIEDAAKAACHGNSAKWNDTLKQCEHDIIVNGASGSPMACANGQAPKMLDLTDGTATFTCSPVINALTCNSGTYLKGFNADGTPYCQQLSSVCGAGQYLRQNNSNGLDCVAVPSCLANQLLYTKPDGTFGCSNSTCGANQYVQGINSSGVVVCKTVPNGQCGSGQYVKEVKADGTLVCDTVPASASGSVAANQYVGGFNSDGTLIARNYPTCPLTSYLTFDGTTFTCKSLPPVSAWSADSNGISGTNTFRNQINGSNASYVSLEISNSAMGNSEARLQLDGGGGYQFSIGSIAYNASTSAFSGYGEPGGGYIGGANTKSIGINTHFVPYTYYTSRIPTLGLSTRRWAYIYLSNSPNVSSDRRLKREIEKVDLGLDFIEELNPVSYKLKADKKNANYDRTRFGFIAQDVSKTLRKYSKVKDTELVTTDDKGFLGMSYDALIAPIVKAIQELSDKVDSLFNQQNKAIKDLELRMDQLEKENRMLEEELRATRKQK